jgi:hypothetical protein
MYSSTTTRVGDGVAAVGTSARLIDIGGRMKNELAVPGFGALIALTTHCAAWAGRSRYSRLEAL